jgi:hypothetical protein
LGEKLGERLSLQALLSTNPQRVRVETMGLEPTTPCLQSRTGHDAEEDRAARVVKQVVTMTQGGAGHVAVPDAAMREPPTGTSADGPPSPHPVAR